MAAIKTTYLFYPTPLEREGQTCFQHLHRLKPLHGLDASHGISWSENSTKHSAAEQESFCPADLPVLRRRVSQPAFSLCSTSWLFSCPEARYSERLHLAWTGTSSTTVLEMFPSPTTFNY